ncbi:isoleucine--tRNA ligase [Georgenia sp. TF02-10]|uniref:isoleucine--tRNA ligase n=1 Tax=Georgenia sp. TF02-10 TaxID=2917725 RepID=UPI001FA75AAE|nr:isoleucine--tRNA ligase [Georgenia sp. TF02-10]UNX55876.1 isoleucine--tRNA ligase [Georgenia sp. TF02-10]
MPDQPQRYPLHRPGAEVNPSPSFPAVEQDILQYWAQDDTFRASVADRPAGPDGANEFVFYDGPPFANGLPHYGHLLTGYVKDLVGRFQTQLGRRVERRFGWDTHGLPAELEAERILGITDKSQIEEMGIEAFNKACRDSVLRYTDEWRDYVTRQARWVDFDNDYKTLDVSFMESVIWAFKQLYDKGLAYEGYRVLPYCWHDQTPLSNHELRMDEDVYQMRQDPAVTVGLRLETGELALIWTTTPWTLPSNLAVAVGPDVDYVTLAPRQGPLAGERVLLAAARVPAYARELGEDPEVLRTVKGADLVGLHYAPIFDYYLARPAEEAPGPNAWTVLAADYVTTEDGTGLVHQAPAFGEEDMAACEAAGIRPVVPVDDGGRFTAEVADYAGTQVLAANKAIIADLKHATGPLARRPAAERAVLVRQETYDHSYPHCWRCGNPLIYKAVSSWFVRVTAFRDRMVELNQEVTWVPEHIKDGQFGHWLAGARDWSVSRNRYWGTPIPVWVSDDPAYPRIDVYGSLAELEADFGRLPLDRDGQPNLHRPFVDELTRPNPDDPTGAATMRRIPDVLDVWFDSGSMPYAQVHYPFENRDWFDHHFPGDFIVEYIGQTRGWFYTLHVLATALFDRPAFRSCLSHGIVLGSDGRKMSKSLRNYPDVREVLDRDGSDAMRWFLMSSPVLRGGNLVVTEEGIREGVRQVLLPLWNTWYFFALYAGTVDGGRGYLAQPVEADGDRAGGLDVMDRYLLARTRVLADTVREQLQAYDVPAAAQSVREHLDLLTNWYVRTSRQRFWDEDTGAFDTLYTALEVLTRVLAPLAPLVSEEIWRGLTGGRSVHLTDWPVLPAPADGAAEAALVAAMDTVREVVSTAHALRKAAKVRVRQPLRTLTVVVPDPGALAPFADLVAGEVNVKEVLLRTPEQSAHRVSTELRVLPRELDPAKRRHTQQIFAAAREGRWHGEPGGTLTLAGAGVDGLTLAPGEYETTTSVDLGEAPGAAAEVLPGGGFVVLDLAVDDALAAEGYARDLVRQVQDERKAAGLYVADRIALTLTVPADKAAWVQEHRDLIATETLATELTVTPDDVAAPTVALTKQEA